MNILEEVKPVGFFDRIFNSLGLFIPQPNQPNREYLPHMECGICQERISVEEMYTLNCDFEEGTSDTHRFCYDCISIHLITQLQGGKLPRCPAINHSNSGTEAVVSSRCPHIITPIEASQILREMKSTKETGEWVVILEDLLVKDCLARHNIPLFHCPGCGYTAELRSRRPQRIECPQCHKIWCSSCDQPYHIKSTCGEVKTLIAEQLRRRITDPKELSKQLENIKGELDTIDFVNTRCTPCPKCGIPGTDKTKCDHMTCVKCHHEWCWKCLGPYTRTAERGLTHHPCEPQKREERAAPWLKAYLGPPPNSDLLKDLSVRHESCTCKSCHQGPIVGIKYKCIHCLSGDFELCMSCEADPTKHKHPEEHVFKAFLKPEKV